GWPELEGGTQMELADLDAVLNQRSESIGWFFEFHGEVTGIIVYAQVFSEAGVVAVFGAHAIEEPNGFTAGLEQAQGFGFKAEMKATSSLLGQARDVFDATPQMLTN